VLRRVVIILDLTTPQPGRLATTAESSVDQAQRDKARPFDVRETAFRIPWTTAEYMLS